MSPGWACKWAEALGLRPHPGIVHRDIKPSNLLLDTAGIVWVSDLTWAKRLPAHSRKNLNRDVGKCTQTMVVR